MRGKRCALGPPATPHIIKGRRGSPKSGSDFRFEIQVSCAGRPRNKHRAGKRMGWTPVQMARGTQKPHFHSRLPDFYLIPVTWGDRGAKPNDLSPCFPQLRRARELKIVSKSSIRSASTDKAEIGLFKASRHRLHSILLEIPLTSYPLQAPSSSRAFASELPAQTVTLTCLARS